MKGILQYRTLSTSFQNLLGDRCWEQFGMWEPAVLLYEICFGVRKTTACSVPKKRRFQNRHLIGTAQTNQRQHVEDPILDQMPVMFCSKGGSAPTCTASALPDQKINEEVQALAPSHGLRSTLLVRRFSVLVELR
ncbi:hypothetical protein ANANG_G00133280 [Anguilla anguilla]|uniref:Uncharacterized protein n=1 Tax=Anguilla anguilla TaxID=7936 RepID=A0A9D3M9H6_ANGAN|nr:hypothetical protein ANANG_G00133280 [Anguilla anguilla]